jgi:hypothetical protein
VNPADGALHALDPALDEFRSAVATAAEEVRAYRAHHEVAAADPVGLLEREMGAFARDRIDPRRLAGLMLVAEAPDPLTDRLMEEAHELFTSIMKGGREAYHLVVPPRGDLRDVVRDGLAELGRAFGIAHAVEKAREHAYDPDRDHELLHPYPFHRWSPLEKEVAPPLVVEVQGADLRASGLVEFLDGWQKIVLVVKGPVPPAALGPGIVALFDPDAGALPFVYRPGLALEVDRGDLTAVTEVIARKKGQPGILDLKHLESLTALPGPVPAGSESRKGEKTVDQLAAWLLSRTDLS